MPRRRRDPENSGEPDAPGEPAPAWFERAYTGAMSAEYKRYMRDEWGHEKRGDNALFEKLSLEGAQAGLSWATILAKREGYRAAFRGFDVRRCAAMGAAETDALVAAASATVVRHRGKVESVPHNARRVRALVAEAEAAARGGADAAPAHGHFDAFLWGFVGGAPVLNAWRDAASIPAESAAARAMSDALRARGFKFVGPKVCYSLMQSCGLVVDHPKGTPEWEAARRRSRK